MQHEFVNVWEFHQLNKTIIKVIFQVIPVLLKKKKTIFV